MRTFQQIIESLSVCHLQDESRWAAARTLVQQDIDEYVRDAGPAPSDQQAALERLEAEFSRLFPDESDPVLIHSYIRRQMRRIGYELHRDQPRGEVTDAEPEPVASDKSAQADEAQEGQPRGGQEPSTQEKQEPSPPEKKE